MFWRLMCCSIRRQPETMMWITSRPLGSNGIFHQNCGHISTTPVLELRTLSKADTTVWTRGFWTGYRNASSTIRATTKDTTEEVLEVGCRQLYEYDESRIRSVAFHRVANVKRLYSFNSLGLRFTVALRSISIAWHI